MKNNDFWWGAKCVLGFLLIGLIMGFVVMFLWNWLIPSIFDGPKIDLFQALGLLILIRILTGGFKHKGHGHHNLKEKYGRWSKLTSEEKKEMRKKFKERWCHCSTDDVNEQEE